MERRPWCWYCGDSDFDEEKRLILHQKEMHFKCPYCNKKCNTTRELSVHADKYHKQTIYTVPNSIKGRRSMDIKIFGMEGIPEADMKRYITEELTELTGEEQLAQHQAMMQNVPTAGQSFSYSGYNSQQNMPSLIPHQHSQFYQRPGVNLAQTYLLIRPGQIPEQCRHPISGVSQPPGGQIQPSTTGTSAIYSNNNIAPASQIYSVGILPSDPSETSTNETALYSATQETSARTGLPNIELIYRDNEVSMEEKRAELEKYRYD
ncbi:14988_t:CDS:2, partial [Funneliformis geosporum]